ncbi:MAG: DUF4249 domain-containing protein [Putridiphycobacter sp.]
MQKFLILFFSLLIFTACEKVIDIPLNDADQKVVIEAPMSNLPKQSYVLLSKTGDVYTEQNFDKISNATVTVTDKDNNIYTFTEETPGSGKYTDTTFVAGENNIYRLKVTVGESEFVSEYITQTLTPLNFIYPEKFPSNNPTAQTGDSTTLLFFSFTDNANEVNYYRFKIFKNGKESNTLYLGDDQLINGQDFLQPFFGDEFDSGDTALVQMLNIDQANYDYFNTLANAQSGGPFSATPGNPITNIEGGALGYFGCYLIDEQGLIIP